MVRMFLLMAMAALIFSCSDNDEEPMTEDCKSAIIDEDRYSDIDNQVSFFIQSILIESDCIEFEIESSGCDGSSWQADLVDSGAVAESLPEQRYIKLDFKNAESCAAVFVRTFSFDISNLKVSEPSVILNLDNWEDSILYEY